MSDQAVDNNAGTPSALDDKPEHKARPSRLGEALKNPVAIIACVATVAVAVVNSCTLWLDRDDRIEAKLDNISNTVVSLNAKLTGDSGLINRVLRMEDRLYPPRAAFPEPDHPARCAPTPLDRGV